MCRLQIAAYFFISEVQAGEKKIHAGTDSVGKVNLGPHGLHLGWQQPPPQQEEKPSQVCTVHISPKPDYGSLSL